MTFSANRQMNIQEQIAAQIVAAEKGEMRALRWLHGFLTKGYGESTDIQLIEKCIQYCLGDFCSFFQDKKLALDVFLKLQRKKFAFNILSEKDKFYCDPIREVLFALYKNNKRYENHSEILYLMGYFLVTKFEGKRATEASGYFMRVIECADPAALFIAKALGSLDWLIEVERNQSKLQLSADQLLLLAKCYHTGPEKNLAYAFKYYQRVMDAKKEKHLTGSRQLAELYEKGLEDGQGGFFIAPDLDKAAYYHFKAAEAFTDHAASVAALQKIAHEQGGIAYLYLGQCYQSGYMRETAEENTVTCYEKAKSISARAAFYLAAHYHYFLRDRNAAVAAYQYYLLQYDTKNKYGKRSSAALKRLFHENDDTAMPNNQYALLHAIQSCNDSVEEFELYKRVANEKKEPWIYIKLAECYFEGNGVQKNVSLAMLLFREGLEQAYFADPKFFIFSAEEAIELAKLFLSKINMPEGKFMWGEIFLRSARNMNGDTKVYYRKAFEFFREARSAGVTCIHVKADMEDIKKLANEKHMPEAERYLAQCYEYGYGGERNKEAALKRYELLATQYDDQEALSALKKLSKANHSTALKEKLYEAELQGEEKKEAYRQLRQEILPAIELICMHSFWEKDLFYENIKNILTIVQDKNKTAAEKYADILKAIKGKSGMWARLHSKKLSENARMLIDAITTQDGGKLKILQSKMNPAQKELLVEQGATKGIT